MLRQNPRRSFVCEGAPFRGDCASASLKRWQGLSVWLDDKPFRGDCASASLKPAAPSARKEDQSSLPRRLRLGLIEAVCGCGPQVRGDALPRRLRLGLIEAWSARSAGRSGHRSLPRRLRLGLIEAARPRSTATPVRRALPRRLRLGLIEASPFHRTGAALDFPSEAIAPRPH